MLDNIDVLRLLKTLTEVSDAFKVLNESTQERITEYLDTQIAIEAKMLMFDPMEPEEVSYDRGVKRSKRVL